ncbi:phosphatase [Clostridia bacterium]|nr:phosphatase [Clostridia bacterium]
MAENSITAVLWDMDGVLIDSEPWYDITNGEMVRSLGFPYGEAEIAKVSGSSYKNIAETLALDGVPKEKIIRLYLASLTEAVRRVEGLVDGVTGFLTQLKNSGVKMAIGSSSPREVVDFAVNKFELYEWIDVIVTGSDAENGKPSPDIYIQCAELLGVSPSECLVFEDSRNGILAGKNAGMLTCAFTGTKRHDFDLSKADFELASFSDALKIVEPYLKKQAIQAKNLAQSIALCGSPI